MCDEYCDISATDKKAKELDDGVHAFSFILLRTTVYKLINTESDSNFMLR